MNPFEKIVFGGLVLLVMPTGSLQSSAFPRPFKKNPEMGDLLLSQDFQQSLPGTRHSPTNMMIERADAQQALFEAIDNVWDVLSAVRDKGNLAVLNRENMEALQMVYDCVHEYFNNFNNITLKTFSNKIKLSNLVLLNVITNEDKINIQNSFMSTDRRRLFSQLRNENSHILAADFLMRELIHIKDLCRIIEKKFA